MTKKKIPIAVADGDGIGPEIMAATLKILEQAEAPLDITKIEIGEKVYLRGQPAGIEPATWDILRRSSAFLKAPITTPQGGGFKSLNVTVRTTLGLYANVRPCVAYYPFVQTKHPGMNVVIVRENEEDLYTGIEYRQSPEVYEALKIMTSPGCQRIVRYAFEYAKVNERKKVTCFSKDNILKMTDGLFHRIFDEIGEDYPEIEKEHWIVDIGAAKLADTPTAFDVIVMPNLYGDILSDVAAQIAGSVGMAGSANIGTHGAMFEAIHGSAPRRAGQNLANPSGLLLAAVQMLVHLGIPEQASLIHNAWLRTLEEGIHTYDIYRDGVSKKKVGTSEFAQAVIDHFGQTPQSLPSVQYTSTKHIRHMPPKQSSSKSVQKLDGVDFFIFWEGDVEQLSSRIKETLNAKLQLKMIANRGTRVWPQNIPETSCVDNWRCRIMGLNKEDMVSMKELSEAMLALSNNSLLITQACFLFSFDGQPCYTVAQDQQ